jgi:hypothetical protein
MCRTHLMVRAQPYFVSCPTARAKHGPKVNWRQNCRSILAHSAGSGQYLHQVSRYPHNQFCGFLPLLNLGLKRKFSFSYFSRKMFFVFREKSLQKITKIFAKTCSFSLNFRFSRKRKNVFKSTLLEIIGSKKKVSLILHPSFYVISGDEMSLEF